ncbi:MAG: hypothetical protein J0H55_00230 [Chitinophagaceae bacterium]|nr:hypothetical protein [Chitinophagaceae bacterium]
MNTELEKERIIKKLLKVEDEWLLKAMKKLLDIDTEDVSDEHQIILNERLASYEADPNYVLDWEKLKEELQIKKG